MSESLEEELKRWEELAKAIAPVSWKTRYGGNFTQVWEVTTDMSQPSERLIADVNFRQSNSGKDTPIMSRRNAAYIAHSNPAFALSLIQKVRAVLKEGPAVHVSAGDEAACIQSTPGSGFPERPVREYIKQFHTLMTGISFVQYGEFRRYADAAEAMIADLQAQLKERE